MAKKSKWPDLTRRVASDSFILMRDEEEFHPHAGEYVVMMQRISPAGMQMMLEFWGIWTAGITSETAGRFAELIPEICMVLADTILEWNWTGPDGKEYPRPHGNPEVIRRHLIVEEMVWLIGEYQATGGTSKNSPGGSTDS